MEKEWRKKAGQEFIDFLVAQEKKRTMQLLEFNPEYKPTNEETDEFIWLESKWRASNS